MAAKRGSSLRAALGLAVLPGLLGVALASFPAAESLERFGLDFFFLTRGPRPEPAGVCVVAIDEDSYQALGVDRSGPWPRKHHAALVRSLSRQGARAIAFDVVFADPGDPEQDALLEDALREARNVVLGSTVEQVEDPQFRKTVQIEPHEAFGVVAAATAEVNLVLERDGVLRNAWLVPSGRPGLALATYELATGDESKREAKARLIDYYGPSRTVKTVSVYQALDPDDHLPPGFFRDKIVFVGLSMVAASGPAAKDAFLTPYRGGSGSQTYGVEIHATIAANLIENRRVTLLRPLWERAFLLALPLVALCIFVSIGPLPGGAVLLGLAALPWVIGHVAFSRFGVWVPAVIPSAVQLPVAYLSSVIWYYLTTVRERERIRRAFSFYLSPDMIGKISADPSSLHLGGEEIVGTALMTDLEGFTGISERLGPADTARMLNAYFSDVTRHIFDTGGTLIKFIGDAVFAIWGAPLPADDHARRACRAALELARGQENAAEVHGRRLVTRLGIHTGRMVVGNLGSTQRFDYTAIGDAVNLAARLEGLNKAFATRILVSRATLDAAEGRFVTRSLGRLRDAGRAEPVEVHELLGERGDATRPGAPVLERFQRALEDFRALRLDDAAAGFRDVLAACDGADGPSAFYLGVIERLRATPPESDWDGVVNFESK